MSGRLQVRALTMALAIATLGWLATDESRAGSTIAQIVMNDGGKFSSGNLMFMFTDKSVSSDQFGDNFTPSADNITVDAVAGGLQFTLSQMATLRGQAQMTKSLTISYTVAATNGIFAAGLSFTGFAMGQDASSSVTETFPGGPNQSLNVFTRGIDDNSNNNMKRFSQGVAFGANPTPLSVTDVATLSIPDRGGTAESDTQFSVIVNTFSVAPEPSSFVLGAIAMLMGGAGVRWRARKRRESSRLR